MKRVVSLSLGSSKRDKSTTQTLLGETFEIRREGTDGDQARFVRRLSELDGTVDAIGFGGMDQYLWSAGRRYEFAAAKRLLAGATKTPVLDGSGLKNTLEREAVRSLAADGLVDFRNSKTLMVCGVDRFGMSEALAEQGGALVFGDLMFALGLPFAIRSWAGHRALAKVLLPLIVQMPLSVLYPMGEKQEQITPKWGAFYRWADVLAGDFHYIRRFLPAPGGDELRGKVLLTNTITEDDVADLSRRGVRMLVTTTPNFDGRSFATNVMEAVIVALHGGRELSPDEYLETLRELNWKPTVRELGEATAAPE